MFGNFKAQLNERLFDHYAVVDFFIMKLISLEFLKFDQCRIQVDVASRGPRKIVKIALHCFPASIVPPGACSLLIKQISLLQLRAGSNMEERRGVREVVRTIQLVRAESAGAN